MLANSVREISRFLIFSGPAIPALFLQSLQCAPPGLPINCCLSIFSRCAARKENVPLSRQAVRSVPLLYLTSKIPASSLVSDILAPSLLNGNFEVQIDVIDALASLVCALAGTGYIVR